MVKTMDSYFQSFKVVLYYGNGQPPNLEFDNTMLAPLESHTHLDVTLSNIKCKWTAHINNIRSSVTKRLGLLRHTKYTINHRALNQIYISFLRP